MESIIDKYSNLDLQLREQFKLYEQKLASTTTTTTTSSSSSTSTSTSTSSTSSSSAQDNDHQDGQQKDNSNDTLTQDDAKIQDSSRISPLENNTATSSTTRTHQMRRETARTMDSASTCDSDEQTAASTQNDDNDYESANDDPTADLVSVSARGTSSRMPSRSSTPRNDSANNSSGSLVNHRNRLVQTLNEDHQENVPASGTRKHQLQLRSQPAPQYQRNCNLTKQQQNNLARGKQQRASISSCSSSDSYASYGSGYASGSGNSTDHEHRHQLQQQNSLATLDHANNNSNKEATTLTNLTVDINNLSIRSRRVRICELNESAASGKGASDQDAESDDDDNNVQVHEKEERTSNDADADADDDDDDDDDDNNDDAEEDDEDSQLKQHLSELEQLTDELAKRDIYPTLDKPAQSTSKQHFTSTIKSNSSQSSSVLSTNSNISSLSSGINSIASNASQQQVTTGSIYQIKQQQVASVERTNSTNSDKNTADVESRSASATPTSCLQPATTMTTSATGSQATGRSGQFRQASNSLDQPPSDSAHTNLAKPANQYAMPSATSHHSPSSRGHQQQGKAPFNSSTSTCKQQSQESYYHNLFQWEQLVSKGVTRPLLINDLDFTDLRDEDDCDLLNSGASNQTNNVSRSSRNQVTGEPLTITIPSAHQVKSALDHDSVDSGASTGSPGSRSVNEQPGTPASAPPPLPPPPISPWFNTISGSRPQSQFMSSPSPPPYDFSGPNGNRDQSPAASTYSSYSRNSVCVTSQQSPAGQQFNTLQPVGNLRSASSMSSLLFGNNGKYANKRKKTMKLFWKEVREDRSLLAKLTKKKTIWDEIKPIPIDTQKLEYLFESKAKDLSLSKSRNGLDGINQRKVKITVLDAKRSNAINIGMTKLPPMRTIKSAILKMDSSIMNREGIEKILTTMMPTEEEKSRIIEAQLANPDTPLGTAEQFLLNLASISALEARLKLWAFQLDYAQIEKEVAEPLMDLKQAIEEIERSETFRNILGTLLSIGNFLNSTNVKGFQIDYLEKVPEVKDTVHKHSLLHHLCLFIQEKFDPELSSDLYSEFSAVNRASKVDYTEVAKNLKKMQQDCKASWDHLKIVAKHDGLANLMNTCGTSTQSSSESSHSQHQPKSAGKLNNLSKLSMITTVIGSDSSSNDQQQQSPPTKQLKMKVSDFLTDCAERIMVLIVIHRRVMNRFQKLLVYLGCPSHQIKQTQPQQILKIINEFALEYRTKRERVRELLLRKQQCQHHHNHPNRWQMSRMRWAGSQQCIDSMSYNNRPCSTASSCASYATNTNCPDCALSLRHRSIEPHHHANQHAGGHRAGSPSGLSQISNYSDYLMDQSCCSRQESITPVPVSNGMNRRPHSMSVSMFDLQQQNNSRGHANVQDPSSPAVNKSLDESELARQKDEQMRRLLGAGKSLDGASQDLYQMSHWSSTMARVTRHPPMSHKHRASSIDTAANRAESKECDDSFDVSFNGNESMSPRRQSSYYRYLHNSGIGNNCHPEDEQNSDEEILQSLVRTATAKSSHHHQNGSQSSNRLGGGGNLNESISSSGSGSASSARTAKSKILSRFNCDRKSLRRTLRPSLESNA